MKYNERDLTEATKIISYLRSIRIYAAAVLFFSLLYCVWKIFNHKSVTELYLTFFFAATIIPGSLSVIFRINHKTANVYGLSCIIAGVVYLFSIVYYRGETEGVITAVGFIAGLIVVKQGVSLAFGSRAREAFSGSNRKLVSFVEGQINSLKESPPNEKNIIRSGYIDDRGEKKGLSIKLIDDVACFLLDGHSAPIFVDRNNVYISLLRENPNSLNVSITVDNHDWLEAEIKPDDFKKYQVWKDL